MRRIVGKADLIRGHAVAKESPESLLMIAPGEIGVVRPRVSKLLTVALGYVINKKAIQVIAKSLKTVR